MLMLANFYTFSKRKNSTKQPTGTGTELSIRLKEDTSIHNPSIVLTGNVLTYNYVYISAFNRYYFVDDAIILTNGMTQYNLSEDVLASNKSAIGSTVAHILYSSTGYNANIVDSRIISEVRKKVTTEDFSMPLFDKDGCFIVSVINTIGGSTGAATQYVLNQSKLNDLILYLTSTDILSDLKNLVQKSIDTIISCIWVPIDYTAITTGDYNSLTQIDTIIFGDKDSNISSYRLKPNPVIAGQTSINIPWHYNDFRRQPPYTSLSMYIPFFGTTDLNAADFLSDDELDNNAFYLVYSIDIATGDVSLLIQNKSDLAYVKSINYSIAVNCPIAQISNQMQGAVASTGGAVGGLVATVASIATGNAPAAIGSGLATVLAAGNAALQYNARSTSIKGTTQGRSLSFNNNTLATTLIVFAMSQMTEDPDSANYIATKGRPVLQTHAISNHSGYVQCEEASVSIAGESTEMEEINSYLNGGFYYE